VNGEVNRLSQRGSVHGPLALKQYLTVSTNYYGYNIVRAPAPGVQAYVKLATVITIGTLEVEGDRLSS